MTKEIFISMYLDTRRAKKSGKYPVKLRIFTPVPRMQKLYNTTFEFSKSEFKSIWQTVKPRREHEDDRNKMQAVVSKAQKIAEGLTPFSFVKFEKKFIRKTETGRDVFINYSDLIEGLKENKQFGTASTYELSLKTIKDYLIDHSGKEPAKLSFYEITPEWLRKYESYMIANQERSRTTVSIYLRVLRAIFNYAIQENEIESDVYPFGKRKYSIPNPRGVKKALSKEQLKLLFEAEPETPEQIKAKAFFFFSYGCNGMNLKDIANIKFKDISGDVLTFRRAKTSSTDNKQAPVIVYLNDFTKAVISQYGNPENKPANYVFNIIDHKADPETQHKQIKNFTRYVNQHFKKYAKNLGLNENISTYWARHSFATSAIRGGASMEYVSEALSHSNLNTTKAYFAGFEDEEKKRISNKLMEF